MPVEHAHTIKAGTTSKLLLLFAREASGTGSPKTGLRHDTPHARAGYIREGAGQALPIPLAPGRVGVHDPGGLVEVDRELLPGVYQFGVPDALLAEGAARVMLLLRFPDASIEPVEIHLVGYDPQDADRLGIGGLANSSRHEFLRRALPRLTEMELKLGEQAERQLKQKLDHERQP